MYTHTHTHVYTHTRTYTHILLNIAYNESKQKFIIPHTCKHGSTHALKGYSLRPGHSAVLRSAYRARAV